MLASRFCRWNLVLGFIAFSVFGDALWAKPKVKVAAAETKQLEREVIYAARLEPRRRVVQQALFQGKVVKHLVSVGDKVKQGQAIMTLERLALGQDFRSYTVRSHTSGRVNQLFLEPAMEFTTGTDLFEIVDTEQVVARFGVSDKDRDAVAKGEKAMALVDGQQPVVGSITKVSVAADPSTGLFPIEVSFSGSSSLRAGQYVRLQVGTRSFSGVALPRMAVVQKFGKPHLYVLSGSKAELRALVLGPEFGGLVGITEGIQPGETYIVEASEDLQDGVEVDVEAEMKREGRRG